MRTENEVIKDFEKLGWEVEESSNYCIILTFGALSRIRLIRPSKSYCNNGYFDMQEHKLLTELFTIWGWI